MTTFRIPRLTALACALALFAGHATAEIGSLDTAPAATLLLPYFEVDLDDPNGAQTRFTLSNVEAAPLMAHVTFWTNLGTPTYSFDVYLGGRDAVEVDLRLAFAGVLPRTSPTAHPPGPLSSAPAPLCAVQSAGSFYPGFPVQAMPATSLAHLQAAHTGRASALTGNLCTGAPQADRIARGYVTVDTANGCGARFPSDPGYFVAGGNGFASNRNALIGTYAVQERRNAVLMSSPMAHMEASATDEYTDGSGDYTFWAKLVGGSGADNREPVGTVWQARVMDVPQLQSGTELVVWRDVAPPPPFACNGALPAPYPLGQTEIAAFNEQETVDILNDENPYPNPAPPPLFPAPYAAQRLDAALLSPFASGFVQFNLNLPLAMPAVPGSELMQSYIATRHRMNGVYGAAAPATAILSPFEQTTATACSGTFVTCNWRQPTIGYY